MQLTDDGLDMTLSGPLHLYTSLHTLNLQLSQLTVSADSQVPHSGLCSLERLRIRGVTSIVYMERLLECVDPSLLELEFGGHCEDDDLT